MLGTADENFSHPHWNNLIHKSCQATVEHFPFCVYSGCGHAIPKKTKVNRGKILVCSALQIRMKNVMKCYRPLGAMLPYNCGYLEQIF